MFPEPSQSNLHVGPTFQINPLREMTAFTFFLIMMSVSSKIKQIITQHERTKVKLVNIFLHFCYFIDRVLDTCTKYGKMWGDVGTTD